MTEDELKHIEQNAASALNCDVDGDLSELRDILNDSVEGTLSLLTEVRRLNDVVSELTRERDIAIRRADWKR